MNARWYWQRCRDVPGALWLRRRESWLLGGGADYAVGRFVLYGVREVPWAGRYVADERTRMLYPGIAARGRRPLKRQGWLRVVRGMWNGERLS